uniref:Uncharacterized protein n=1 Tax=Anguilla anguilla TaxID=7936 RepID=A0A0E9VU10_ANGAN
MKQGPVLHQIDQYPYIQYDSVIPDGAEWTSELTSFDLGLKVEPEQSRRVMW